MYIRVGQTNLIFLGTVQIASKMTRKNPKKMYIRVGQIKNFIFFLRYREVIVRNDEKEILLEFDGFFLDM